MAAKYARVFIVERIFDNFSCYRMKLNYTVKSSLALFTEVILINTNQEAVIVKFSDRYSF